MSEARSQTRPHRAARPRHGRRAPSPSCSPSGPTRSRRRPAAGPRSPASSPAAEGDFGEILERSDLIVELIGGTDPARELRARRAAGRAPGRHRQQAAARPARRRALRRRPRGRRAAALRGRGRRRDPDRPHDPGELRRHRDRQGLRDRQRHDQLHPQRDGGERRRLRATCWPGRRSSATPRPTRPTTSAAPTPRRRWRSSPGSPSTRRSRSTRSPTRGSRRSSPTTSPTPRSSASR